MENGSQIKEKVASINRPRQVGRKVEPALQKLHLVKNTPKTVRPYQQVREEVQQGFKKPEKYSASPIMAIKEKTGLNADEKMRWITGKINRIQAEYNKTPVSIEVIQMILDELNSRLSLLTEKLNKINSRRLSFLYPDHYNLPKQCTELQYAIEYAEDIIKREKERRGVAWFVEDIESMSDAELSAYEQKLRKC